MSTNMKDNINWSLRICLVDGLRHTPSEPAVTKTITETLEREFFSRLEYPRMCLT